MHRIMMIAALVLAACGGGDTQEADAAQGVPSVGLTVTDTIGVELGDSNYVFGYLADAARTDSMIYALDMSRGKLQMYTPEGDYSGYFAGKGNGPGETVMPQWFVMFPDGSFLLQDITDLGLYTPDGQWVGHVFTHSGNWPSQHTAMGPETFTVRWHEFLREPDHILRQFIASYDLEGDQLTEYMTDSIRVPVPTEENTDALNRSFFSHYFTGDLDGNLYITERHIPEYRIVCLDPDGAVFDTLALDVPVVERTEEEMALRKRYVEEYLTGMGTSNVMEWVYEPDTFKPPISGLWLGWNGNLWVLRGNRDIPVFDVWKIPQGELLYTAELDMELPLDEFLTFYITPWCRDFLAVHEDAGMVQRLLLVEADYSQAGN
ncbi:MAG: hypothetical protein GF388_01335 [Candidatus Aegiribacteria sp.]|nr:hypothetical protein [Candidatus Aegiribacteria sp.]